MLCLHHEIADDGRLEHRRLFGPVGGLEIVLDLVGILKEFFIPFGHLVRDDLYQFGEAEHAVAAGRGDIGTGKKRLVLRRAENGSRPAAGTAVEQLVDLLVVFVEVGALLPVDFDADEMRIQIRGDLFVFEHFVLHNVAPVTAAVADGDEDGTVLGFGAFKSLVAPGIPVDGIVFVLLKVGRIFEGESVLHVGSVSWGM